MTFLVDANILSEPTKPNPNPNVIEWLRSIKDSLIAATALVHNLVIATHNRVDFEGTGVNLIDPFTQRSS